MAIALGCQQPPRLTPLGRFAQLRPLEVRGPICLLGSRGSADLRVRSSQVQPLHALLISDSLGVLIRDLAGSGAFVNDQRVSERKLHEGDRVRVGPLECRFSCTTSPAALTTPAPPVVLRVQGHAVRWLSRTLIIGREEGADLRLVGGGISRIHAILARIDDRILLRDAGSHAGTMLNGEPVSTAPVSFGDEIEIAGIAVRVEQDAPIAPSVGVGFSQPLPVATNKPLPRAPGVAAPANWGPLAGAICRDERLRPVLEMHRGFPRAHHPGT